MNLTSKSRYALKILLDLAYHADQHHVQRRDIGMRQGIPTDYLDQIMMKLRSGDLVKSVRGRGGGYFLARPADEITVWDLFSTVESHMEPASCVDEGDHCEFDLACSSSEAWRIIYGSMRDSLEKVSIQDLVGSSMKKHHLCPVGGIKECRSGQVKTNLSSKQPTVDQRNM